MFTHASRPARPAYRYPRQFKGSGNLRLAVRLPEGEDLSEWLAVHGESNRNGSGMVNSPFERLVVDFFNHLNMLYGTITEFCTPQEVRIPISEF